MYISIQSTFFIFNLIFLPFYFPAQYYQKMDRYRRMSAGVHRAYKLHLRVKQFHRQRQLKCLSYMNRFDSFKDSCCHKILLFLPINSIAALPDEGGSFVSVGEDRTLRIWKGLSHTNSYSIVIRLD